MSNLKNLAMAVGLVVLGGVVTMQFGSRSPLQFPAGAAHSPMMAWADPPFLSAGISTFNLDEPGRIPFQQTVHREGQCVGNECFFSFGFVPTGKRLVVTRISGAHVFNAAPSQVFVYLNNGSGSIVNFIPEVNNFTAVYDHQTEAYLDAGQFIEVQISPFPSTFLGGNALEVVTLAGYMLNCSATTPCNAFAATSPNHP